MPTRARHGSARAGRTVLYVYIHIHVCIHTRVCIHMSVHMGVCVYIRQIRLLRFIGPIEFKPFLVQTNCISIQVELSSNKIYLTISLSPLAKRLVNRPVPAQPTLLLQH